jgi:hypothetical protein
MRSSSASSRGLLARPARPVPRAVFNFHCPPLDVDPGHLPEARRVGVAAHTPLLERGQRWYYGAGSQAVADALSSYQRPSGCTVTSTSPGAPRSSAVPPPSTPAASTGRAILARPDRGHSRRGGGRAAIHLGLSAIAPACRTGRFTGAWRRRNHGGSSTRDAAGLHQARVRARPW